MVTITEPGVPPGYTIDDHSVGMQAGGVALILLGTAGTVVGFVGLANALDPCDGACHDVEGLGAIPWAIAAGTGGFVGLLGFSIGIPLVVVGAEDELVPADDRHAARGVPEVRLGPTSGSLSFTF